MKPHEKVKAIRQALGISKREIAMETGLSISTVASIEQGRRPCRKWLVNLMESKEQKAFPL